MTVWCIILFATNVYSFQGATTISLKFVHDLEEVAAFGDAQHRGEKWQDLSSSKSSEENSELKTDDVSSSSSVSSSLTISSSSSSEASSAETKERRRATETFRSCHPCPHDMLKKHDNLGIKWICAAYQRARRTFKSDCMMRYRNCQDGTMFVKLHDHRCKDDKYHGRHYFYVYKT